MVKSSSCPIALPSALDDEVLATEAGVENTQPKDKPSKLEFFRHTLILYDILSDIMTHFYKSDSIRPGKETPDRRERRQDVGQSDAVIAFERRLNRFSRTLPACLTLSSHAASETDLIFVRQSTVLRSR